MPNPSEPSSAIDTEIGLIDQLRGLLNLRADTDRAGTIELIRANVDFQSANAWTLVFAIFIASIGLNVNSTAVIIGAMLISPLMGPIVSIGFSLGTDDFVLLKKSARNLAAAVMISVFTSTLYFLLSPLSEVQSELLARTRPSFYDVLIAFFGGAAGFVALSRKEKGNAIPGVAIATALMPPLCTAGFGLATRNFGYFLGAMYLFVINGVFISISTFLFVRYLGFHRVSYQDSDQHRRIHRWILGVATAVMIPSFVMAWYLQQESSFRSQANRYIRGELQSPSRFPVDKEIAYSLSKPMIRVTLLGAPLNDEEVLALRTKAKDYNLNPEAIEIHQTSDAETAKTRATRQEITQQLRIELQQKDAEIQDLKKWEPISTQISQEILAVFPKCARIVATPREGGVDVWIQWKTTPTQDERTRATAFLSKRLNVPPERVRNLREL